MKLGLGGFWQTAKIVFRKVKFTIPLPFNAPKARLCLSNKTKSLCDEKFSIFSKNFNLNDSDIYLPVFPCGNNQKLYIIPITPKLVKKLIINFDSSKVPGPDYIPVVVQKNCEPNLSYILALIFYMCLKESCFVDCWKVWSEVPVFNNVGERSKTENYHLASLLSLVSKFYENL